MDGEGPLLGSQPELSLCSYMVEGTRNLSGASFIKVLISFMKVPLLRFKYPPKSLPTNMITFWGWDFNL